LHEDGPGKSDNGLKENWNTDLDFQVPNIVLNTMWIDNVSRSRAMKEQLEVFISFDTSIEDVELLRKEMESFVRHADNNRDFHPDIVLECTGIGNMDKLQLKVEIRHKSNWSNETVRASRRSKFMCALVLALRKVPIYNPGGGNTPLGDPGNPSYTVAVSDDLAQAGREKAAKTKEQKRLVPSKPKDSGNDGISSGVDTGVLGSRGETKAADELNSRRPTDDAGRDGWGRSGETATLGSREESPPDHTRSENIDNLRHGLLKRESTRGRRRPGEHVPPQQTAGGGPGLMVTQASPRRLGGFDEEAAMGGGIDERYNSTGYLPGGGGASSQAPSYSMYPSANASNTGSLQPLGSSPPSASSRMRGMSLSKNQSSQQSQDQRRL
jgi:hypothetical protein